MSSVIVSRRRRRRREEEVALTRRQTLRSLRDSSNPFSCTAGVFCGKYRLTQELTLALIEDIKGFLSGGNKCFAIPAEIKACDSDLKILNILARFPGSSHDSFIWRNSALRQVMQEINENGEECWLLGDSGYPSECWLLTPILNAAEGSPEAAYTVQHIRARNCVERCIGVLKGRFRCISKKRSLEYHPQKAGKIVNACAVLHNMCIVANLPSPDEVLPDTDEQDAHISATISTAPADLARALVVRSNVIRRMIRH